MTIEMLHMLKSLANQEERGPEASQGNYDDVYTDGFSDGQKSLAMEILTDLGIDF